MFVCLSNKAIDVRSPTRLPEEQRETPSHGESYHAIWSRIQSASAADTILHPTTQDVERVVSRGASDYFRQLELSYFQSTDTATRLCFFLCQMLKETRDVYLPLNDLLVLLPVNEDDDYSSLTESQCNTAYLQLERFNSVQIPFLGEGYQNFEEEFVRLTEELKDGLQESRTCPLTPLRRASSAKHIVSAMRRSVSCLRVDAGVTVPNPRRKRSDLVTKVFFVMNGHLDGLQREAELVKVKMEGHMNWVKIGVDMGPEPRGLFGILKELRKSQETLFERLTELQKEICRCFGCIFRTRDSLFSVLPMDDASFSPSFPTPS